MKQQIAPETVNPVSRGKARALPALTGIRGVAAVWVVLYHAQSLWDLRLPLLSDGFRAVDLFFVLSGFIMMHAHQADFVSLNAHRTFRFFGLRALRVYPLNVVILLLILPFIVAFPAFVIWTRNIDPSLGNAYSFAGFWQTLFLANRWLMRDLGVWNGTTWSLSVELLAYLSFPIIAFLLNKEESRIRCAATRSDR